MNASPTSQMQQRFDDELLLGNPEMDQTHREFLDLHAELLQAKGPAFGECFNQLLEHTRAHFSFEEDLMTQSDFPSTAEHKADHQRFLGELDRFAQRVHAGSTMMAKAWLKEQVPDWFLTHVISMDSALAAHLKK